MSCFTVKQHVVAKTFMMPVDITVNGKIGCLSTNQCKKTYSNQTTTLTISATTYIASSAIPQEFSPIGNQM